MMLVAAGMRAYICICEKEKNNNYRSAYECVTKQ